MARTLSRHDRETLRAVARILIPSGGQVQPGADDLGIADQIADSIDTWSPGVRREVRWMLRAMDRLPMLRTGRPFRKLSAERQRTILEANYRSPRLWRRFMVSSIKQLCYATYVSHPQVEAVIGYGRDCARPPEASP